MIHRDKRCFRVTALQAGLFSVTALSSLILTADDQGWFEVKRSVVATTDTLAARAAAVDRTSSAPARAVREESEVESQVVFGADPQAAALIENGWQPVPSVRKVAPTTGAVPDGASTTTSHRTGTDASTAAGIGPAVSGRQPSLIMTRGEIHELRSGSTWSRTPALDYDHPEAAITRADERQQLRNHLPVSNVSTLNIDMFAGEVKVLGKVDVERVAIGNGDIVRAEVLKTGELLVIGEIEGSTSLRLWHKDGTQSDYNIRVSRSDPETRVRMERMVRMRVRMIEFRKSALGKLGIDWSDSAAGPGFAIAGDAAGNNLFRLPPDGFTDSLPNTVKPFSTYFGVASSITSRINFLASTGDAVTLAEPVLSTTNGGSASFLAGGEVPYPSVGANGQTVVQFKEYGIKLNVSPLIDAAGNVRTLIETEISQLDPAVSVQGAPGLLTRRAQTQVNVRSGETIVISGLLSSEDSKDIDKLPGIGNLPIIGSFFRSRNVRNAVSELVIFVTPEIVDPSQALASARHQAFLQGAEARRQQAQRQIRLPD